MASLGPNELITGHRNIFQLDEAYYMEYRVWPSYAIWKKPWYRIAGENDKYVPLDLDPNPTCQDHDLVSRMMGNSWRLTASSVYTHILIKDVGLYVPGVVIE